MLRYASAHIGIDDNRIVCALLGEKELRTVRDAARDAVRQSKIAARQLERMRVDVDDRQLAADTRQHRRQRPAAASDHQDGLAVRLPNQIEDRVDIGDEAHAIFVRLALETIALDIEERTSRFALS